MKLLKLLLEMVKSIFLVIGLIIFMFVWLIALLLLWFYDAIFGGWHEPRDSLIHNKGFSVAMNQSPKGLLHFNYSNNPGNSFVSSLVYNDGTWHHLIVKRENDAFSILLDKQLISDSNSPSSSSASHTTRLSRR